MRFLIYFDNYTVVLFQTPSTYISMYCNTFASIVAFVRGFELEKWQVKQLLYTISELFCPFKVNFRVKSTKKTHSPASQLVVLTGTVIYNLSAIHFCGY